MYNLRYHIASLVGVFLALALGLVLGGLVVGRGTLDRQQEGLVEGLRREFTTLRTENADLTEQNEVLRAFATQMTDDWVTDRLVGRTVVVMGNSGREDGRRAAQDAIASAGGKTAVVTLLKPGFGLDDEDVRSSITTLTGSSEDVRASVEASLAAEWYTPLQERPLTDALVAAGAISVEGLAPGVAAAGIVDLAAPEGEADPVAVGVAAAFPDDAPAMGAQTPNRDTGVATAADAAGIAGFDTLGTEVGRFTLVALLSGAERGLYGLLDGAQAPFPAIPGE